MLTSSPHPTHVCWWSSTYQKAKSSPPASQSSLLTWLVCCQLVQGICQYSWMIDLGQQRRIQWFMFCCHLPGWCRWLLLSHGVSFTFMFIMMTSPLYFFKYISQFLQIQVGWWLNRGRYCIPPMAHISFNKWFLQTGASLIIVVFFVNVHLLIFNYYYLMGSLKGKTQFWA